MASGAPPLDQVQSPLGNSDSASAPESSKYDMPTARIPLPAAAAKGRVVWHYAIPIALIHVLALAACIPWLFDWVSVAVFVAGVYFFGGVGINLCYHRLLTHRAFKCPQWLERFFVIVALCCMEDSPGRWVATHRLHHKVSDEQEDPHSPLVNFLWSHMGWLMIENRGLHNVASYEKYARDILKQPWYFKLERRLLPIWIYLTHAALFTLAGAAWGWWRGGADEAIRLGLSVFVWGVLLRTVAVWHITWSVNSLSHLFGYQTYKTGEASRNNWFVAFISSGEGWHNNHHAQPASASNRHRWWEIDGIWLIVWGLEKIGLAWDVVRPRKSKRA
jgi:fatty-acid desaturase